MTTQYKHLATIDYDSTPHKKDSGALYTTATFNVLDPKYYSLLAVVAGNRVGIYAVEDDSVTPLDVFVDEPTENYYTCCWAENERGEPLVLAGGQKGLIRVINLSTKQVERTLVGHGDAINDLVCHPRNRELVVSASRDESARLWDVVRGRCVAIFAGAGGHTEQVLTADIHVSGERLVTGGVDNTLKIWSLNTPAIQQAIADARTYDAASSVPFKSVMAHFPRYSSNKVHSDYVDCVKWWGDLLLSKAPHELQMTCWTPPDRDILAAEDAMVPLVALDYPAGTVWFIKFALDDMHQMCAAGNDRGEIHVWCLHEWLQHKREARVTSERVDHLKGQVLSLPASSDRRRTVRTVHFSHRARYLAAAVEGGVVHLYRR